MTKTNIRLCSRCGLRLARKNNSRCSACARRQAEYVRPELKRPSKLVSTGCQIIDSVAILELPFGYALAAPLLAVCPEAGRYWFDIVRVANVACRVPILRDAASVPKFICEQRRELGFADPDPIWIAVWTEFELDNGYADDEALQLAAFEVTDDHTIADECLEYTTNLMVELGVLKITGQGFDVPVIRESRAERGGKQ
ncbi:MAG: hypothetical protein V3V10_10050 [Planctomycetota bacterium]